MDDCVFCKISRGELKADIIYENKNFFSILDIKPFTEGHTLVISKKHFETFLDMPKSIGADLIDCIKESVFIMMKKTKADGFNIVSNNKPAASQIIPHVHFHLLPRKNNDGFKVIH